MNGYGAFAAFYDALTDDVDYAAWADSLLAAVTRHGGSADSVLDLACGSGSLSLELAARGCDVIGVDGSADMLAVAREKAAEEGQDILFLCQDMRQLDLYGTVDAAICSLDGITYMEHDTLRECFRRLTLFIRPGGLFIFDIRTPEILESLDGQIFVDEKDDVLCLWRADYDEELPGIIYGMDIFSRRGRPWKRESEEHVEYSYEPEYLEGLLQYSGFTDVKFHPDCPQGDMGRLFYTARRKDNV